MPALETLTDAYLDSRPISHRTRKRLSLGFPPLSPATPTSTSGSRTPRTSSPSDSKGTPATSVGSRAAPASPAPTPSRVSTLSRKVYKQNVRRGNTPSKTRAVGNKQRTAMTTAPTKGPSPRRCAKIRDGPVLTFAAERAAVKRAYYYSDRPAEQVVQAMLASVRAMAQQVSGRTVSWRTRHNALVALLDVVETVAQFTGDSLSFEVRTCFGICGGDVVRGFRDVAGGMSVVEKAKTLAVRVVDEKGTFEDRMKRLVERARGYCVFDGLDQGLRILQGYAPQ